MNRQQRRASAARSGRGSRDITSLALSEVRRIVTASGPGLRHPVPVSVELVGGPMDGWVVQPDAAALRPDWHAGYAQAMTELGLEVAPAGRYGPVELDGTGVRRSSWIPAA